MFYVFVCVICFYVSMFVCLIFKVQYVIFKVQCLMCKC